MIFEGHLQDTSLLVCLCNFRFSTHLSFAYLQSSTQRPTVSNPRSLPMCTCPRVQGNTRCSKNISDLLPVGSRLPRVSPDLHNLSPQRDHRSVSLLLAIPQSQPRTFICVSSAYCFTLCHPAGSHLPNIEIVRLCRACCVTGWANSPLVARRGCRTIERSQKNRARWR